MTEKALARRWHASGAKTGCTPDYTQFTKHFLSSDLFGPCPGSSGLTPDVTTHAAQQLDQWRLSSLATH